MNWSILTGAMGIGHSDTGLAGFGPARRRPPSGFPPPVGPGPSAIETRFNTHRVLHFRLVARDNHPVAGVGGGSLRRGRVVHHSPGPPAFAESVAMAAGPRAGHPPQAAAAFPPPSIELGKRDGAHADEPAYLGGPLRAC